MSNDQIKDFDLADYTPFVGKVLITLRRRWLAISALFIAAVAGGLFYRTLSVPTYKAETTFVLVLDEKPGGKLGNLASQLGADVGLGSDNAFSGENILVLLTSHKMIRKALAAKVSDGGKINQTLFDLIIGADNTREQWVTKDHLKPHLTQTFDVENPNPVQDSLLTSFVEKKIRPKYLTVSKADKKTSYYSVQVTSPSEEFSAQFCRQLVNVSSDYYIETKTQSVRKNLSILNSEADSLRRLLSGNISAGLNTLDRTFNLNPGLQTLRSPVQKSQLNTTILSSALAEVLRNLEIAKITLLRETPLYALVDTPGKKLVAARPALSTVLAISLAAALALTIVILLVEIRRLSA